MVKPLPRLKLQGFNNLTKSLSFNIYDVCYAASEDERRRYIEYIDEAYNADRLTQILTDVAEIIGANILNIARQDYDPQGASVTILISEEPVIDKADAKVRSLREDVKPAIDAISSRVHDMAARGKAAAAETSAQTREKLNEYTDKTSAYVAEQPLKSMAIAAAAGAALALLMGRRRG